MAKRHTTAEAWAEEDRLKEEVYAHLEEELKRMKSDIQSAKDYVGSGAYEDQDAFTAHGALSSARRKEQEKKREYAAIFSDPYFTHMEIRAEGEAPLQIMLSDRPELEHSLQVGPSSYIMPFMQSTAAPMLSALFEQYSRKQQGEFRVDVRGNVTTYRNELLRDVEISGRTLKKVVQFFPDLVDEHHIDADELLEKRLEENRSNAQLRNIIKTLQSSQFQIIRAPLDTSFVVQGCAGSGKTQCLIHRLFFMRAELDDRGWEKVLLITPTRLFRNYSQGLMQRYHLTDVADLSLADLYQSVLSAFDPRFKNRQYQFELTEEFLPDDYLRQVYDEGQIRTITEEIDRAVKTHVQEALKLLDLPDLPGDMDAALVSKLVGQLDMAIQKFDDRAEKLSEDPEYMEHLEALERLEKQLETLGKRRDMLEQAREQLKLERSEYDRLKLEIGLAEDELKLWQEQMFKLRGERQDRHRETIRTIRSTDQTSLSDWNRYRKSLYAVFDACSDFGERFQRDRETERYLEEIAALSREDLVTFTDGKTERDWLHRFSDRRRRNDAQLAELHDKIQAINESIEAHSSWLRAFASEDDDIQNQRHTYRAGLERARYYLGRIESSLFEQEVWNALAPLKERCGISVLRVEKAEDGHQRQTRILYTSDLLFYLLIYLRLHKTDLLPKYRMICIDEGQDLHSADYRMLRRLFPNAVFNVFGDVAQTLHEACGITDWERETGISQKYILDTNYRNTAATVDFCNCTFHWDMRYVGTVRAGDKPILCQDRGALRRAAEDADSVVIVKERSSLEALCRDTGIPIDRFSFLDTTAEAPEKGKLSCYSVFAAKGLEFPRALVYARGMTNNQRTVACTRAMQMLYYYDR